MFKELPASTPKNFLKLKGGSNTTILLRGEPHTFFQHYVPGSGGVICPAKGCPLCLQDKPKADGTPGKNWPSFRFAVNVAVLEDGKWVAKVWENSKTVYNTLFALQQAGVDLANTGLSVLRQGDSTDTSYTIFPAPKALQKADFDAIVRLPLVDVTGAAEADDVA